MDIDYYWIGALGLNDEGCNYKKKAKKYPVFA
jgi:hypothetical protein